MYATAGWDSICRSGLHFWIMRPIIHYYLHQAEIQCPPALDFLFRKALKLCFNPIMFHLKKTKKTNDLLRLHFRINSKSLAKLNETLNSLNSLMNEQLKS